MWFVVLLNKKTRLQYPWNNYRGPSIYYQVYVEEKCKLQRNNISREVLYKVLYDAAYIEHHMKYNRMEQKNEVGEDADMKQ
jgi:predicted RNase H-related nuclease YkuK (DUF458 family)